MVACDDDGPLGVLFGCKRDDATLIWRLAIHPEHQRQGHARHLLASLSSKLAILGPPTLKVELPESRPELDRVFSACGYTAAGTAAAWVLEHITSPAPPAMVIPFSADDLLANRLFDKSIRRSWQRGLPSLEAQSSEITGLAAATFDGIEAFLLARPGDTTEIITFGCLDQDRVEGHLRTLLAASVERFGNRLLLPKLTEEEIPHALLVRLGLRREETYQEWKTTAQPA
jgi:hypothetical protein